MASAFSTRLPLLLIAFSSSLFFSIALASKQSPTAPNDYSDLPLTHDVHYSDYHDGHYSDKSDLPLSHDNHYNDAHYLDHHDDHNYDSDHHDPNVEDKLHKSKHHSHSSDDSKTSTHQHFQNLPEPSSPPLPLLQTPTTGPALPPSFPPPVAPVAYVAPVAPVASLPPGPLETFVEQASKLEKFVDELPLIPTIKGYTIEHGNETEPANITIGMYEIKWKFHRNMPLTTVYAYGASAETASVPGPTVEAMAGVDTYVRWENHLPSQHMFAIDKTLPGVAVPKSGGIPTVVHLHGGLTEPKSDGYGDAWFTADFREKGELWRQEVYHYHNAKHPGMLWYHDHTSGYTRVNLLSGMLGAYVIRDPVQETPLNLPSGEFERILFVFDRSFYSNGTLFMNSTGNNPEIHPSWQPEFFGEVIVVNGKAWPFMRVSRRKYRFRIINTSNSRYFSFYLDNGLSFTQVASDAFYLDKPVRVQNITLAVSEIADVIIDFSESKVDEIILRNNAPFPYPGGDPVNELNGQVMKFVLEKEEQGPDPSKIPDRLFPFRKLHTKEISKARYITLFEYESPTNQSTHMELNFHSFKDKVTEIAKQGTTELWHIVNLSKDDHPMHWHVVALQAVSQWELNVTTPELKDCAEKTKDIEQCNLWKYAVGTRPTSIPDTERGWKNVFKVKPGYVTSLLIRFSQIDFSPFPFDPSEEPGYVYHCHILEHEDNIMMRPLQIDK